MAAIVLLMGCAQQPAPPPPPPQPAPFPVATVTTTPPDVPQPAPPRPKVVAAPLLPSGDVPTTKVTNWSYEDLVPFQKWKAVPATVVGLVVSAGKQPWGGGIVWSREIATSSAGPSNYHFKFDRTSAYAVYWESDGRGYNFLKNWSVPLAAGGAAQFDAAMFNKTTPNTYGLHRDAHLIRAEVNGGRAGSGGLHFVITDAEVLDGTEPYPIDPEEVLLALRKRFDATVAAYGNRLSSELSRARKKIPKGWTRSKQSDRLGVSPTWVDSEGILEAIYVIRHNEGAAGPATKTPVPCPPCPCSPNGGCAPCARCVPRFEVTRSNIAIRYDFAVKYQVDKRGQLVAETIYEPNVLSKGGTVQQVSGAW